ncbi:DUF4279 domain-containing protein [Planococcus sp. N028]|uniref:DUF4279 domain-containing protein n=1 Tax=Planococcus shixiaomingii TaxID=3058393 RepID=A0ABT8MZT7_9BACL|nr:MULTISPECIES: DUF4279 domain-containing protein [unclassified Planococcus (in: firmicutes)]MDN7240845.1 DUF4279 domain-containing protein [Planococcus sp. N028]WKA53089.1 DUF4279 domain-containing protein [Planococcus sp. N022]
MFLAESEVKVSFRLHGEEFPTNEVSEILELTPTETYQIGDVITDQKSNEPGFHKETIWEIGTAYEKSLDVKMQLDKTMDPLYSKVQDINKLREKYGIKCLIMIVLIIEKGETPAMYLEKKQIDFASQIEAEFHWDLYANPYVSDF